MAKENAGLNSTNLGLQHLQPPKGYKIDNAELWRKYRQLFELYIKATDFDKESDAKKIAIFLTCAGEDMLEIYNGMSEVKTWKELLVQYDKYFNNKINTVVNSYRFYNLRQEHEEPVDKFVSRLKTAAKSCNFKEEERMVRDMLVIGLRESNVKERLLREKELNLETAVEICRAAEYSRQNVKELDERVQEINLVKERSFSGTEKGGVTRFGCRKCGRNHLPRQCPAYGRRCTACNMCNHYAAMCRNNKKKEERSQSQRIFRKKVDGIKQYDNDSDCSSEEFVVDSVSNCYKIQWNEIINVEGVDIKFKLDSGADCNTLPLKLIKQINTSERKLGESTVLVVYNGQRIKTVGTIDLNCVVKGIKGCIRFCVVDMPVQPVLGLPECIKFNLIRKVDALVTEEKTKFVQLNQDVFTGLGNIGTYNIKLKENAEPVVKPIRRVPLTIKEKLKETLSNYESRDIIGKVEGPTAWCNNLVIVEKPDKSLRLCLDPKELNKVIMRENYQIPSPEEIYNSLSGKEVFTVV